jgi:signal transduction histidine kinase
MRRLRQQIYLTIIATLIIVVLIAGAIWRFNVPARPQAEALDVASELVAAALPDAGAPPEEQGRALRDLSRRLRSDLALFDADRRPIASSETGPGEHRLPPPRRRDGEGWIRGSRPPAFAVSLPDGRWLVMRPARPVRNPVLNLVLFLGAVTLAVGLGAYPLVRRLTRRLETLQQGVETLGAGDLAARVPVEGNDEVAQLAASFNRAAAHIEELVGAHRLLLANASHELRTPLSRIRLGLEMLKQNSQAKIDLTPDVAELDTLIDEILLASRLGAQRALETNEDIDLLALLAEECARYENTTLDGAVVHVRGDPRILRRLIRNLLENAKRHGIPPVQVSLRREGANAVFDVTDAGPGIPEDERERVFTPFYRMKGTTESTGAGLGLSLVRQIAELHGGTAIVAALPDGRSAFRVTIPAA